MGPFDTIVDPDDIPIDDWGEPDPDDVIQLPE